MTRCGWKAQNHRLRNQSGSVLVTVLAVLAILLTIFLGAMTYSLSRFSFHTKGQNRMIAGYISEAGISRMLGNFNTNGDVALYAEEQTPNGGGFYVSTTAWGPYYLTTSDGTFANQTVRTCALIGSPMPEFGSAAITVCDENHPFTVAGHTRIVGDVNTGGLGIATGRIKGEGVTSNDYHTGENVQYESLSPPSLDTVVLGEYFSAVATRRIGAGEKIAGSVLWNRSDSSLFITHRSVFIENNLELSNFVLTEVDEITSIFVAGFVEIRGSSQLSGLVEIVAGGPIYVRDSSTLDGAILYSQDSVVVSQNASLSATAIAHKGIYVRDRASLVYPSSLLVDVRRDSEPQGQGIFLSSRGWLESVCFLSLEDPAEDKSGAMLFLDTSCVFVGAMVSQGLADIRGRVYGTIITEQFRYELPPTTYINWVRDLYIDRGGLDFSPALPVLSGDVSSGKLAVLRRDRSL